MAEAYRRLAEYQSLAVLPLTDYPPGVYTQKLFVQGNSILSSLLVLACPPGASVSARWYDVTLAEAEGEEYDLVTHNTVTTAPVFDRRTVTRLHDKPRLEVTVTGGTVRLGVYVSVVASFASDLDAALVFDAQIANLLRDKAIPIATYDEDTNQFEILRTQGGVLPVSGSFDALPKLIDKRLYNASVALAYGASATHVNYTVPTGKKFTWLSGFGSANALAIWDVSLDGSPMLTRRCAYDNPNVDLDLKNPVVLSAGQQLIVDVTNRAITKVAANIDTWIYGSEENE